MRKVRPTGYDLFDKIPTPKKTSGQKSMMISQTGTKRSGRSNDKKITLPELAGATSASGLLNLGKSNEKNKKEEDTDLTREEFGLLLEKVGLGEDQMLIDKLFWVFDEDGSGNIGHKELAIGLEMLKDNTFEEKLDVFFDLCDEDGSGTIDKKSFYNLLRLNATTSYEDRDRLKFYVNQIFNHYYDTQV
jgi:EF-hand domain pair